MQDQRFDDLTRLFARQTGRRGLLKALVGGVLAVVTGGLRDPDTADAAGTRPGRCSGRNRVRCGRGCCPTGTKCCGGTCCPNDMQCCDGVCAECCTLLDCNSTSLSSPLQVCCDGVCVQGDCCGNRPGECPTGTVCRDHHCRCDTSTGCNGCCLVDVEETCEAGDTPDACGSGGQRCQRCTVGEVCDSVQRQCFECENDAYCQSHHPRRPDCVAGRCTCRLRGNCPGCCKHEAGLAYCFPGDEHTRCGSDGGQCTNCVADGEICSDRQCDECATNDDCDAKYGVSSNLSCIGGECFCGPRCSGCCANDTTCVTSTSGEQCGISGSACDNCTAKGQTCVEGSCSVAGQCQTQSDCAPLCTCANGQQCGDVQNGTDNSMFVCRDGRCCLAEGGEDDCCA